MLNFILIQNPPSHIHEIVVPHILHFRSHPILSSFPPSPAPPSARSSSSPSSLWWSSSSSALQSSPSFNNDFFRRRVRMPYSFRQHSKVGLLISSPCLDGDIFPDLDFRSSRLPHKSESFSRRDARVSASVRRLKVG